MIKYFHSQTGIWEVYSLISYAEYESWKGAIIVTRGKQSALSYGTGSEVAVKMGTYVLT